MGTDMQNELYDYYYDIHVPIDYNDILSPNMV